MSYKIWISYSHSLGPAYILHLQQKMLKFIYPLCFLNKKDSAWTQVRQLANPYCIVKHMIHFILTKILVLVDHQEHDCKCERKLNFGILSTVLTLETTCTIIFLSIDSIKVMNQLFVWSKHLFILLISK